MLLRRLYRSIIRIGKRTEYLVLSPIPSEKTFQNFTKTTVDRLQHPLLVWLSGRTIESPDDLAEISGEIIPERQALHSSTVLRIARENFRKTYSRDLNESVDLCLSAFRELSLRSKYSSTSSGDITNSIGCYVCAAITNHLDFPINTDSKQDVTYLYRITFINFGEREVKLLGRHWLFMSERGTLLMVPKFYDGVIGQTPTLCQNEVFEYTSKTILDCPRGTMTGAFLFEYTDTKEKFEVPVKTCLLRP